MRIYSKDTVLESAQKRIAYLFDEFPNVIVGFSGGKDSTVVLHLALDEAKKRKRLPLKVLFIDQEGEWQHTIDYVKKVMYRPDVEPLWFQMPMVITNNASSFKRYNYCWDESDKESWIHEKDRISIKVNNYGTDRFHELFEAIIKKEYPDIKTCYLSGVRTEEAPKRYVALTTNATYKHITYGKALNKNLEHYTIYPIYDWSYTDVWKFIHDKKIEYNKLYDEFYRHKVPLKEMRVSNVHHETAVQSLMLIQEIEPQTWNKIAHRIDGANTIKHLKNQSFQCPKELPNMFESWEEYAMHLAKHIIQDDKRKTQLLHTIEKDRQFYNRPLISKSYWKVVINTILSSDWDFTKYKNWKIKGTVSTYRIFHKNPNGLDKIKIKWLRGMIKSTQYLTTEEKVTLSKYLADEKHV